MTERSASDKHPCSAGGDRCAHCANEVRVDLELPDKSDLHGAALVWSVIGSFMVPVMLAIAGSLLARSLDVAAAIGALVGLVVGMTGAIVVFRWIGPKQRSDA